MQGNVPFLTIEGQDHTAMTVDPHTTADHEAGQEHVAAHDHAPDRDIEAGRGRGHAHTGLRRGLRLAENVVAHRTEATRKTAHTQDPDLDLGADLVLVAITSNIGDVITSCKFSSAILVMFFVKITHFNGCSLAFYILVQFFYFYLYKF